MCYHVILELGQDDNLTSAKTKILTKINTEIRKIKTSKGMGGTKPGLNNNNNFNFMSNTNNSKDDP